MLSPRVMCCAAVLPLCLLPSCAWSNVANRPVWNAFERNVVPDSGGLFVAALPVTIPLGLASIVVDAVIAHPLQVVDDAYGDAARIWDPADLAFDTAYYTEMAFLPIRTVGTPIAFAGSFLARCVFDIRAPRQQMTKEERVADAERRKEQRDQGLRTAFIGWLRAPGSSGGAVHVEEWHASFDEPMRAALAANAARRVILHTGMLRGGKTKIGGYDAEVGLRDPDPVVRYVCLKHWPHRAEKPPVDLLQSLRADASESVRMAAEQVFALK